MMNHLILGRTRAGEVLRSRIGNLINGTVYVSNAGPEPFLGLGGGKYTLSALYCIELRQKLGVIEYQNSSWDICDLIKKVSGPKIF